MRWLSDEETEKIEAELNELQSEVPEIEGLIVLTKEGFPIASSFRTIEPALLAAITATINNVSDKALEELQKGHLEAVMIQGEHGHLIVQEVGDAAIIAILADKSAKPGLLYLLATRFSEKIVKFL